MNKNPFSIYDFLGYLFPGFVAITLVIYVILLSKENPNINDFFSISNFIRLYEKNFGEHKWESATIVLVLSYIAGHVIGYLSSTTVEYLTNKLFNYPSSYLLHQETYSLSVLVSRYFINDFKPGTCIWRLCVIILLLPVSFVLFLLSIPFSLVNFIVRPLDSYIVNSIYTKINTLSEKLELNRPDVNQKIDYHRIIMHYVYLNVDNSQRKLDNYVAMYGFLRALTLIACSFFDYLLCTQLFTIYEFLTNGFHGSLNVSAIFILSGLFVLCNVLYMAFVKFYRRFTVENYMALLVDKNLQSRIE